MTRILLPLFLLLATALSAQEQVIKDFIKEHRRGEENIALKVPGWMIGLASDIATISTDDRQEKAAFQIMGELGTVRFVTFLNEDFPEPQSSVNNLLFSLENYHGFERWAEIRSKEGERITLSVRYQGKTVRNIIAVVSEPDEDRTIFMSARAHLSARELGEFVNKISEI